MTHLRPPIGKDRVDLPSGIAVAAPLSAAVVPADESLDQAVTPTQRRSPLSEAPAYAALDLGTNNCRLLVARPSRRGFKVIDAFSRIIRLGEGVTASGRLNDPAMTRTFSALQICAEEELQITHHLLMRPEKGLSLDLSKVRAVYSHPQALAQCRGWLARYVPNATLLEASSTA